MKLLTIDTTPLDGPDKQAVLFRREDSDELFDLLIAERSMRSQYIDTIEMSEAGYESLTLCKIEEYYNEK